MEESMIPVFGMLTAIIINLGLFATISIAIYFSVKARNKERMALIERGVDISEIYKKKERNGYGFFKFGVVVIGLAFGLLLSTFFANLINPIVAYFSMILLGGGIGVIIANYLVAKKLQK